MCVWRGPPHLRRHSKHRKVEDRADRDPACIARNEQRRQRQRGQTHSRNPAIQSGCLYVGRVPPCSASSRIDRFCAPLPQQRLRPHHQNTLSTARKTERGDLRWRHRGIQGQAACSNNELRHQVQPKTITPNPHAHGTLYTHTHTHTHRLYDTASRKNPASGAATTRAAGGHNDLMYPVPPRHRPLRGAPQHYTPRPRTGVQERREPPSGSSRHDHLRRHRQHPIRLFKRS